VERYSAMLKEANANFQPSANFEKSVEVALQSLAQRKIISNHKEISVRAPEIINYYANTIAHHFESKLDSGNEEYLPDAESVI
jgi:hypothetical protein